MPADHDRFGAKLRGRIGYIDSVSVREHPIRDDKRVRDGFEACGRGPAVATESTLYPFARRTSVMISQVVASSSIKRMRFSGMFVANVCEGYLSSAASGYTQTS
jgi:hypothetical protein